MFFVEATDAVIGRAPYRRARQQVFAAADDMAQRMAAKGITAKKNHIERQHNRADTDAEGLAPGRRIDKKHSLVGIIGQQRDKS